jgi:hypothetical protein
MGRVNEIEIEVRLLGKGNGQENEGPLVEMVNGRQNEGLMVLVYGDVRNPRHPLHLLAGREFQRERMGIFLTSLSWTSTKSDHACLSRRRIYRS